MAMGGTYEYPFSLDTTPLVLVVAGYERFPYYRDDGSIKLLDDIIFVSYDSRIRDGKCRINPGWTMAGSIAGSIADSVDMRIVND